MLLLLFSFLGVGFFIGTTNLRNPTFSAVYAQLGIQPLPTTVERHQPVQNRLAQLSRESCYRDAVVGLAKALLDVGYPRESAISLRSFAKRCRSVPEILPLAYKGYERVSDFSGALEVAKELVDAAPANGTFRYWRAMAYEQTGNFALALTDYMNSMQLVGDPKNVSGDVFYKLSRTYAALTRYCDAITPIEMYISLDPANRGTFFEFGFWAARQIFYQKFSASAEVARSGILPIKGN